MSGLFLCRWLPKVKLERKIQVDTLVNATNGHAYFLCSEPRAFCEGMPAWDLSTLDLIAVSASNAMTSVLLLTRRKDKNA